MPENKPLTGYPSIDKPWLKYYSEEELAITEPPKGTLFDVIFDHNKNYTKEIAIEYYGRNISYGELFEQIEKCCRNLSALGVKRGDIVAIQSMPNPQVIVLMYALNKMGACGNMLYPDAKAMDVIASMEKTDSGLLFALDKIYEQYEVDLPRSFNKTVILMNIMDEMGPVAKLFAYQKGKYRKTNQAIHTISWKQFICGSGADYQICHDENLPAFMLRTGGTTGIPKEVVLSSHNFSAMSGSEHLARVCVGGKKWERKSKCLLLQPPFIAFGIGNGIHNAFSFGFRLIVVLDVSPQAIAKLFVKYKPNIIVAGTVQIGQMIQDLADEKVDLSSVEMLAVGGDAISAKLENEINGFLEQHNCKAKMTKGYGLTEISASVIIETINAHRIGSVGIPIALCNMKVIDENTGEELPYNTQGEICLSSPGIMLGYYHNPKATDEIIEIKDGVKWLHTGDVGEISEDGFLTITGRIKRIIVVKEGNIYHKVFPIVSEEKFLKIPELKEISIVGRSNPDTANELVSFFVLENNEKAEQMKKILKAYADQELESFERPCEFVFIDKLPRTLIGKVDYRKLEEMAKENGI